MPLLTGDLASLHQLAAQVFIALLPGDRNLGCPELSRQFSAEIDAWLQQVINP